MNLKSLLGLGRQDETPPRKGTSRMSVPNERKSDSAAIRAGAIASTFQRKIEKDDFVGGAFAMDSADDCSSTSNIKSGLLTSTIISDDLISWYGSQGFIGYQLCAMFAQHWFIDKACTMPAVDAMEPWFKIHLDQGDDIPQDVVKEIEKLDEAYKLPEQLVDFERKKRIFGIRIAMFIVESDDEDYYKNPFNLDGVKPGSYKGIVQIDPLWCAPILAENGAADPTSPNFFNPLYWRIGGKDVHRSHLMVATTGTVPDSLKPTYRYGGVSVPQKLYERVYASERTANEVPELALTKRADVLKTDIETVMADRDAFKQNMLEYRRDMNNHGLKIIDNEDVMERFDTSLADLDNLIMTEFQLACAIAEVNATKMLGTSPKGFNSTGEFEQKTYNKSLESVQKRSYAPFVQHHHQLLIKSEILPRFKNKVPQDFAVKAVWNAVDSPTEKEWSEINLNKANTDQINFNTGAIDGADIRARLIADEDSGYTNLDVIEPDDDGNENQFSDETNDDPLSVSLDAGLFDVKTGKYDGATLITNQKYLNAEIVERKIKEADYRVQVSPVFEVTKDGSTQRYRIVIDGHHSLAACVKAGSVPEIVEGEYNGSDYLNAVNKRHAFDAAEVLYK